MSPQQTERIKLTTIITALCSVIMALTGTIGVMYKNNVRLQDEKIAIMDSSKHELKRVQEQQIQDAKDRDLFYQRVFRQRYEIKIKPKYEESPTSFNSDYKMIKMEGSIYKLFCILSDTTHFKSAVKI